MKKINHRLSEPPKWYSELIKDLPSKLVNSTLFLSTEIGDGFLQYIELQKGLWAQQIEVRLFEEIELFRIPSKTNDYFVIEFYLFDSELSKKIEKTDYTLGFENVNLLLLSSTTSAITTMPYQEKISIFNIVFTKEWLFENVLIDHASITPFFDTDEPIYVSENLDYQLKKLLKKIDFNDNKLTVFAYVLRIIDYLFNRVNERNFIHETSAHIHPEDLNQLLEVRNYIDENTNSEITLEILSEKAGMSLSKFKRLFKQVFGTTPYQYHLSNKMEKSMEALQQETYNVSEIGYIMGYSNLSQFSKAFKNHFGLLPSQVNSETE